ncbi:LytTR family DNA-binding domain-containing protein [Dyadobacter sp. CY326]|uniref:LytR/AlgR family response regulator transcription factor n=1 Tax=Dyadobacter sp. CY326 TaxID=2907300 RepID=UPI001F284227|nr:LytTR family DNA-binding domain-containing protein [Dyadobacter sp. CY326]MCE7066142.1 LytTR family transcriptional regulator DNA-binding domain-containing protein [Dyadobacter sp. CY326]
MISILVIEEEAKLATKLQNIIEQFGSGFKVCAIVGSIKEAKKWLVNNKSPHLIICGVRFPDGLIFKLFQDFTITCPVIYYTEDYEFAMKAFENNGIDYLVKPVDSGLLNRSLEKFCRFRRFFGEDASHDSLRLSQAISTLSGFRSSILVYFKDQIIPINLDKVDYIYYNNYQVTVYSESGQYETRDTLNNIFETLNPRDFFRANRQFIIHRKSVTSIQQYFGRKLLIGISCRTPEPVIISKANATDFLKWLEGLHVEENVYQ